MRIYRFFVHGGKRKRENYKTKILEDYNTSKHNIKNTILS